MTPALGITFFPVSTGRTSQPVPLFDHGFCFCFLASSSANDRRSICAPGRSGTWMQVLFLQRCDPNVFVSLALVLLHECQLYPDGAAIFPPHDKNKTWSYLLVANFLRPSVIFITRHGWSWVPFWSCIRAPGNSTLLIPLELWRVRFFWCAHVVFRCPIGIFCAWNIDNVEDASTHVFSLKKSSLASETHSPEFCFRTRNYFSLSLSGTPPLSLLLMPERTILLPFELEPLATH